jgi:ubiquinone/menaquinone biosynthesis C-methylase UbiE
MTIDVAADVAKHHVHDIYDQIAHEFDATRHSKWNAPAVFLKQLPPYVCVADIGCGNGKYADTRNDIYWLGSDVCESLLNCAQAKLSNPGDVMRANAIALPFISCSIDAAISVAVLHHMPTLEQRRMFLYEMIRILRPGGSALITVWAKEQPIPSKWCAMAPNNPNDGDYMIPWTKKSSNQVLHRYYHLFTRNELVDLCNTIPNVTIESIDYECHNWVVTVRKIKY